MLCDSTIKKKKKKKTLPSLMAQTVKNLPVMQKTKVQSLGQEDPLEKRMATHSSILPREFRGQRSLAGYSPWGHRESDTTEQLTLSEYIVITNVFLVFTCDSMLI